MHGDTTGADDDLLYIPLTSDEVAGMMPLLREYEDAFGFDSRGQTVEQLIDTRCAPDALELARAYETASDAAERSAASKMAEALEAALDYGSYVELAF
jgi:hypothetical protein